MRHDGTTLDSQRVRFHVSANLMRSSVPREVVFAARLPRNPAGKVVTRELLAKAGLG